MAWQSWEVISGWHLAGKGLKVKINFKEHLIQHSLEKCFLQSVNKLLL
jgi:hypothetical protein